MNCCDYNCHQGKNCPIRQACHVPIDVPIQFWDEPDEPPIWPELAIAFCVFAAAFGVVVAVAWGWI